MKSIWRSIRNALVSFANFFYLLVPMPLRGPRVPQSHTGMAREAMHVSRRGSGTTATDKFLATEISKGHQIKLHGDPGSARPVASYGGRPPMYKRRSGLITIVLFVMTLAAIIGWVLEASGRW